MCESRLYTVESSAPVGVGVAAPSYGFSTITDGGATTDRPSRSRRIKAMSVRGSWLLASDGDVSSLNLAIEDGVLIALSF